MEWKHYWRNVVKRYHVMIEGWPSTIPFRNLSEASSSLSDLESLLRKWRCGTIHWKRLDESEFEALDATRDQQIENGEIDAPVARRRRSDFGKKRPRSEANEQGRRHRKLKKHISAETVHDDNSNPSSDDDESIASALSNNGGGIGTPGGSSTGTTHGRGGIDALNGNIDTLNDDDITMPSTIHIGDSRTNNDGSTDTGTMTGENSDPDTLNSGTDPLIHVYIVGINNCGSASAGAMPSGDNGMACSMS